MQQWVFVFAALSLLFAPAARSSSACDAAQFKRVQQDAARGIANAQTALGDNYADGRCVAQDYAQAAVWYRRGAEQGNADGQFALAMLLLEGKEVTQSSAEAAEWFRRAADQNHALAQYALGSLYVQGKGLPRDLVKGYQWIRVSSPEPDRHTQDVLAGLAKSMSREEIERAETAAASWMSAHPGARPPSTSKK